MMLQRRRQRLRPSHSRTLLVRFTALVLSVRLHLSMNMMRRTPTYKVCRVTLLMKNRCSFCLPMMSFFMPISMVALPMMVPPSTTRNINYLSMPLAMAITVTKTHMLRMMITVSTPLTPIIATTEIMVTKEIMVTMEIM